MVLARPYQFGLDTRMLKVLMAATAAWFALSWVTGATADTLIVNQLAHATYCPVFDGSPAQTQIYGQISTFPHLTTVNDATGTPYVAALAIDNFLTTGAETVTICAFSTSGALYGASRVTMPASTRLYVTTQTTSGDNAFSRVLLSPVTVISSGTGSGGTTGLPSQATFTLVVGSTFGYARAQAGFIGNSSNYLSFYNPATINITSTIGMNYVHIGAASGYATYIYVMNTSFTYNAAVTFTLYDATGTSLTTQSATISPMARTMLTLSTPAVSQFGYGVLVNCPSNASSCSNTKVSSIAALTYSTSAVGGLSVDMVAPFMQQGFSGCGQSWGCN